MEQKRILWLVWKENKESRENHGVDGKDGANGQNGTDGQNGKDGVSPLATIIQTSEGATISIIDKNGTTAVEILNGKDGKNGVDGKDGLNGKDGANGKDGKDGVGVPAGGITGQVLVKKSNTDYDTEWVNQNTGGGSTSEEGTMIYKGTWNSTDTYSKYDVVEYGNLFFVAVSDVSANKNPNSNPTLWKKMNYTSNYNNVQTTNSASMHYINGTPGTGNNQGLVIPAATSNRASFNPSTGEYNFPILKTGGKEVATQEYIDSLVGNVESLLGGI